MRCCRRRCCLVGSLGCWCPADDGAAPSGMAACCTVVQLGCAADMQVGPQIHHCQSQSAVPPAASGGNALHSLLAGIELACRPASAAAAACTASPTCASYHSSPKGCQRRRARAGHLPRSCHVHSHAAAACPLLRLPPRCRRSRWRRRQASPDAWPAAKGRCPAVLLPSICTCNPRTPPPCCQLVRGAPTTAPPSASNAFPAQPCCCCHTRHTVRRIPPMLPAARDATAPPTATTADLRQTCPAVLLTTPATCQHPPHAVSGCQS